MSETNHSNRIPFEDIASSSAWDFPSWDEGAKVVPSVKKKNAESDKVEPGRVEDIDDAEQQTLAPITASQLQQMSEEAEREGREHGYKEGYEQGFAEGEKKGTTLGEQKAYGEVKQRLDEQRERFSELADALLDPIAMQDGGLENLVLDMAVHFAKHLINRELTEDPSSLFDIVKRAAASLPAGAQNIRIYLHVDDVELAHEAFASSGRDWTFYSDAQLSRGGCRIESSQSLIDFSIEQRLQQMLEEVNYQGEIDPEAVAPVADYRPPPSPSSASEDTPFDDQADTAKPEGGASAKGSQAEFSELDPSMELADHDGNGDDALEGADADDSNRAFASQVDGNVHSASSTDSPAATEEDHATGQTSRNDQND